MLAAAYKAIDIFPQFITGLQFKDGLDILTVAILIYLVLIFIKQTRSFFIFNSVAFLLIISYISKRFDLSLTRQLFQPLLTFFLVIYVIVFQREIRRFFDWFFLSGRHLSIQRRISMSSEVSSEIVKALEVMAKKKIGGIIVFPGEYPMDDIAEGGFLLDGKLSTPLILSIFDHSSPGHDGAMIVQDNRIKRFGVHLPLAEDFKGYAKFGTRHRAAAGITESTDALAIVISEERGTITLAESGALRTMNDIKDLEQTIREFLKENILESSFGFWHYFFVKNFFTKISSFILACILWVMFVFQTGMATQDFIVPIEFRYLPKDYIVEEIEPRTMIATFTGRDTDLASVDIRQIKAVIDLTSVGEGAQSVRITNNNITYPSYLDLTKISPNEIKLLIKRPDVSLPVQ